MAKENSQSTQLIRLGQLTDVIFALVIWRIFTILPRPDLDNPEWDSVADMLLSEWVDFVVPMLAVPIVIVYWL